MAPELSSNWKLLQARLKQDASSKNKVTKPKVLRPDTIAKRRRLALQSVVSKQSGKDLSMSKMGASESPAEADSAPSASMALWAEDNDISAKDLAEAYGLDAKGTVISGQDRVNEGLVSGVEIGQYLALDCEMVGVGDDGERSVLARVSLVNYHGTQVYDSFVRPKEFVTDWRTHVSGVSSKDMATARSLEQVQADVTRLLQGKILVGHAIKHDLEVLMLGHPKKDIRDTSRFSGFRRYSAGKTPSLKKLAKEILGVDIQGGEHSSIEDARATMLLFRRHKQAFDVEHASRFQQHTTNGKSSTRSAGKGRKR